MQPDSWIQILLRSLPAIIVFGLGFMAATDKRTREQWNNVLCQIGSIRPNQREDLQIGRGVKWPFFIVAVLLLIWPIRYYRLATRTFEVKSNIYSTPSQPASIYDRNAGNTASNAVEGNAAAPANNAVSDTPPANIYGQPR